ncbi:hypothetical protein GM160_06025 [Guyparkeria halophila]|uniref:Terminase small subunit n=1 Tax=Guyparkeria halophila TaxID=47960 RepID=A0A6I6D549_9GAMM|nr:terminase small subunit [Guyparkeria halophila]QGT78491.1 hypothetical protein GM160_06025 [Guyparkeria halophila]
MQRLTERQRRFVEAYAASGNATGAARAAGYKHPHAQGPRLLENVGVAHVLRELADRERSAAVIDREQRQAWWSAIMRGEITGPDGEPPAIRDRLKASELLGKAQGDFVERREITGAADPVRVVWEAEPPARIELVAPGERGERDE